jgi:uncharacterized protein YqeY
MGLKQKIDADIKTAMLAKEKETLNALRGIKSLILLEETKEGTLGGELSEAAEITLLNRAAKQRRESATMYREQNRIDLAEVEETQLAIVEKYLPKQLSTEELETAIKAIIEKVGAKSAAEIGKVMGVASKELSGQADGKTISETAKRLLS